MSTSITIHWKTRRNLGVNGAVYKTPRPGGTTKSLRRQVFLLCEVPAAVLHVYTHTFHHLIELRSRWHQCQRGSLIRLMADWRKKGNYASVFWQLSYFLNLFLDWNIHIASTVMTWANSGMIIWSPAIKKRQNACILHTACPPYSETLKKKYYTRCHKLPSRTLCVDMEGCW